jgi:energy-coupling factor transporter ATP-binding protein EcfA2
MTINAPLVLINGGTGTGKSTLIEAVYCALSGKIKQPGRVQHVGSVAGWNVSVTLSSGSVLTCSDSGMSGQGVPVAYLDKTSSLSTHTNEASLNEVMQCFAPRSGVLPLSVTSKVVKFADGTTWDEASSGLRFQLALASLQSEAASIVLLDDPMEVLDSAGGSRMAGFIRQLAYTTDQSRRKQVFLTCRGDEQTTRLLHLLTPPDGEKLQVIDLLGVEHLHGPILRVYNTRPKEMEHSPEQRLAHMLVRMWAPPLRPSNT